MRAVVGTTALVAALVAVVLLWFDGPVEFTGYQVLLLVLAAATMRRLRPPEAEQELDEPFQMRIKPPGRPHHSVPPQLEKIERLVSFGGSTAFDAEWRLLPFLRSIAAEQLATRHGVALEEHSEAVRLLGAPGWELLNPDRPLPGDRMAPGLDLADLDAAVTAIEGL